MKPINAYQKLKSFREEIRQHLSALLIDTDLEHPLECDIELDAFAHDIGLADLPRIVQIYQDPSEGIIWYKYDWEDLDDEDVWHDIDDLWTDDLVTIVDRLEKSS